MSDKKKILIVDDEENMLHMLSSLMARSGYEVTIADSGSKGIAAVDKENFDCILCDLKMPNMDGIEFLKAIGELGKRVTIIMMSAYATVDRAVEAMKLGAYDFITKPFKPDEILLILERAIERDELRLENRQLKQQLTQFHGDMSFDHMVAGSDIMQELVVTAKKAACYDTTVLITGESGTGKELMARGLCQASTRRDKPFIAVNCGSIPETLLESEFFGHVKGAFTGAVSNKKGLFEEADGGTLFLDEIGELPLNLQVKLLRVLQEDEVKPVGSSTSRKINVRILAATARDLEKEVAQGTFRQDLYFRLNVIELHIPALKHRASDIPLLCNYFITKFNNKLGLAIERISPAAMAVLMQYDWPGNIRELENVMERAVIFAENSIIQPGNLPENLHGVQHNRRIDDFIGTLSLKKGKKVLEERLIGRALETTGGNKSKAAELLELSYPSLLSKIKKYKLHD